MKSSGVHYPMENVFVELGRNRVLLTTILSWTVAQTIKVALGVYRERRFDFRWFVGTGGLPSSHAAGVAALATAVGLTYGFDSVVFAVASIFSFIVMFDAQGVRRATGKQAEVLNRIIDDIYVRHEFKEERLKELLGHTPVEVLAGACLGILLAVICYIR